VNKLEAKGLNNEEKISELVLADGPFRASERLPMSFVLENGERLDFESLRLVTWPHCLFRDPNSVRNKLS
jgi:hypothetical protein